MRAAEEYVPIEQRITDELRRGIENGEFAPGQRLIQQDLARRWGVSRMPVREALKKLEAEGLVRFVPYRGVEVVKYSKDDINEIYIIRKALEVVALRYGAPNLTLEDFNFLEENLRLSQAIVDEHNYYQFTELNIAFHCRIYNASGLPRLVSTILAFWKRWPRSPAAYIPGRIHESLREHRDLLAALRAGDIDEAVRLLEEHVDRTRNAIASKWVR